MTWYGNYNDATKQLDALLDKKPTFQDLLNYHDFIPQLKTFSPKLLDYITNSRQIPKQIVTFITVPPTEQDTIDRQYKFPLLTIQTIQTQTTCIINCFFKESQIKNVNYLQTTFQLLKSEEVLPILAGYFQRTHEAMLKARYRQSVQTIYKSPQCFDLMIKHCTHQTISQCIQYYLNLELSKQQYMSQQKTSIKVQVIRKIINKIDTQRKKNTPQSNVIIQNLISVLSETIDKYYLIADGKFMLQAILEDKPISMIIQMISKNHQYSSSAMKLCLFLMKYYTFSSYNAQEQNEELNRKNMERLQSQPLIIQLINNFSPFLTKIKSVPKLSLYHYSLLQVLSHCVALSSMKIFSVIKQLQFYPSLIDLLFKHEYCNILHKLIERSFLHVFETNKKIYELYKRYLFCEISIIDLTARRVLDAFPEEECFKIVKKKGYFGVLMKIIKIYSGIQTLDQEIREAITAKKLTWNKLNKVLMRPYEILSKEELGTLANIPAPLQVEFMIKKTLEMTPSMINNSKVIEEVKMEQTMQNLVKSLESNADLKKQQKPIQVPKIEDDTFFKVPVEQSLERKNSKGEEVKLQKQEKKSDSFKEFMVQKSEEINLQRSQSSQRKLSAGKRTRMASPSPNRKKNSWKEDSENKVEEKSKRINFTKDLPKIPTSASNPNLSSNKLTQSAVVGNKKNENEENSNITKSMSSLEDLKKITIVKVAGPEQKRFRKIEQRDKILLGYLGINL